MKIRPVGAELFHADRRTGMTKLTVAFRNFANAPKTVQCYMKWERMNYKHKYFTVYDNLDVYWPTPGVPYTSKKICAWNSTNKFDWITFYVNSESREKLLLVLRRIWFYCPSTEGLSWKRLFIFHSVQTNSGRGNYVITVHYQNGKPVK